MFSGKTIQTLTFAATAALLTCHPAPTRAADPERAAAKVKAETAPARNWVKEAMLTLKVRNKILTHIKTSDALRVHIDTEGRTVTLTGEVEKQANLALAASLAKSVEGVQSVTNNLTVAPDTHGSAAKAVAADSGHEIADAMLETKVKSKLLAMTGVHALKINVEAKEGAVTLSGSVTGTVRRDKALSIVRATGGVKSVVDQMTVTPSDDAGK